MKIRKLMVPEMKNIYETEMQRDFLPEELKPLADILRLREENLYVGYGWFEEEELRAYAFLCRAKTGRCLLLDYFAVCAPFRSMGYGSRCLVDLREACGQYAGILAEVEDADAVEEEEERCHRQKRISFYERNRLRHTSLVCRLFGVDYILMYAPCGQDLPDEALFEEMEGIYHTLFDPERYEKHVRFRWRSEEERAGN